MAMAHIQCLGPREPSPVLLPAANASLLLELCMAGGGLGGETTHDLQSLLLTYTWGSLLCQHVAQLFFLSFSGI